MFEPIITLTYLLMFWYVSVDLVFGINSTNEPTVVTWSVMLLGDIALNLNTVKLSNGKALKIRKSIALEYLSKESYIDLIIVLYLVLDAFDFNQEVEMTKHILLLIALTVRLSRKGELLRSEFAFKKYTSMIDSLFLLFSFAHLSVQYLTI